MFMSTPVEKYAQKTTAEVGDGSFDQVDLQLLNDYNFIFILFFCDCTFNSLLGGRVIYNWQGIFKTFPIVYHTSRTYKTLVAKTKNTQHALSDCISSWSKEPQPISATVLLGIVFYYCKEHFSNSRVNIIVEDYEA